MTDDFSLLYVGTHRRAHRTDEQDAAFGIYAFHMPSDASAPFPIGVTETPQPGWLAAHPSGRFLYAVNEVAGGGVSAFAIAPESGALLPLNSQATPALPCHCEVDATGGWLVVATFGGGSIHLFPLQADGRIGPEADTHHHSGASVHPRRQAGPHAHGAHIDPANRFVLVPDLGTDQVLVYELDRGAGRLLPRPERAVALPPGSGPRHIAFGGDGRFAYLMNEMSATIAAFSYDEDRGALEPLQITDLLPEGFAGHRSGAEVAVHPDGRFLYATTRSHGSSGMPPQPGLDSIVWFGIDPRNGLLRPGGRAPSGGGIPRTFAFDRGGARLLVGHQCSGTIVAFAIDAESGAPVATGETIATPVPLCLLPLGAQ